MEVLRGLIAEFAIFSAPTPDEEQITTGVDDTENDLEGQDEFSFAIGHDDDEEHGEGKCTCAHDDENGLANNKNIEVIEPEEGGDDEVEFNLDDEPESEEPTEDEDAESKFKFF